MAHGGRARRCRHRGIRLGWRRTLVPENEFSGEAKAVQETGWLRTEWGGWGRAFVSGRRQASRMRAVAVGADFRGWAFGGGERAFVAVGAEGVDLRAGEEAIGLDLIVLVADVTFAGAMAVHTAHPCPNVL